MLTAAHNCVAERPYFAAPVAEEVVANVHTDLDPFSPNEIEVLMKHTYQSADRSPSASFPTPIYKGCPT
jgi:hypothetical protein